MTFQQKTSLARVENSLLGIANYGFGFTFIASKSSDLNVIDLQIDSSAHHLKSIEDSFCLKSRFSGLKSYRTIHGISFAPVSFEILRDNAKR